MNDASSADIDKLVSAAEKDLDDAFDEGYENGYEDGYAAGKEDANKQIVENILPDKW